MKKIFGLIVFFSLVSMIGCSGGGSDSVDPPNEVAKKKLNIIVGNTSFVSNNENLAQLGKSNKASSVMKSQSITDLKDISTITTESGANVTAEDVIQVNDSYVLLKGLISNDDEFSGENYILNVTTGNVAELLNWPSDVRRIAANKTNIYYITSGKIVEISLSDGIETVIGDAVLNFTTNYTIGYVATKSSINLNSFLFIDENEKLWIYNLTSTTTCNPSIFGGAGTNWFANGQGGWYTKVNGKWEFGNQDEIIAWYKRQTDNNQICASISGNGIAQNKWLVVDPNTSILYMVDYSAPIDEVSTSVSIYKFDINTFSRRVKILTQAWNNPNTENKYATQGAVTMLGRSCLYNLTLMTDGVTLFSINHDQSGDINLVQRLVDINIPISNTARNSTWNTTAVVTNWNYLGGTLYILNPSNSKIYSWDTSSIFSFNSEIGESSKFKFYY